MTKIIIYKNVIFVNNTVANKKIFNLNFKINVAQIIKRIKILFPFSIFINASLDIYFTANILVKNLVKLIA